MSAFVSGLLGGFVIGVWLLAGLVRRRSDLPSFVRSSVLSFLGVGTESSPALPAAVVEEIRREDPALAQVVEAAPAVAVETTPELVSFSQQEAIKQAPSESEALKIAARFIPNPDLARVVVMLCRWRTSPNNSESQYQNSFLRHVRKSGWQGSLKEKVRIEWAAGGGSRVAVPDLILDDKVLVELKADLMASGDTDRALGQMLRYLLAWKTRGSAVLAICGRTTPELKFLLLTYTRTWRRQLNLPVTIFFKQDGEATELDMPTEAPRLESGQ